MSRPKNEYTYTYDDIAALTGLTVNSVSQHKVRGEIIPEDLGSVALYLVRYGSLDFRRAVLEQLLRREVPDDPGGWQKARGDEPPQRPRPKPKLPRRQSTK